MYIYDNVALQSSWNEKYFRKKLSTKSKHILCSTNISPKNGAVCDLMWKDMVQPDRLQMTIKYDACCFLAGYLRLQIRTQNV